MHVWEKIRAVSERKLTTVREKVILLIGYLTAISRESSKHFTEIRRIDYVLRITPKNLDE